MYDQNQSAWTQFTHTGRIEDYLAYCRQTRGAHPVQTRGVESAHAAYTGWDRSAPVQERDR